MKIVLTAVNAKYIHSNLAVHTLKKYTEVYGDFSNIQIETAEYTINQNSMDIMNDLYRRKPDILCFSCYIWNITHIREIAAELKKVLPDVRIWCGGPEVSYEGSLFLAENKAIDGVMKGEGENTFLALCRFYLTNGAQSRKLPIEIPGILYRDEEHNIRSTEEQEILDMDLIPFCYEDMSCFEHRIIYYESSRGCPFSCSYCLSSVEKKLRFRSFALVEKELEYLVAQKVTQIKFVDRTFNCDHKHFMEIISLIRRIDLGITNFHFEISADLLTEEELSLLSILRPGLVQLEIGVQSTNSRTIAQINRAMDLNKVKKNVEIIQKSSNIHQHLDLIAGLPFEDYSSFQNSFRDVYQLRPDQLQLGFLKILKGSYIYQNRDQYEMKYQDMPPYEVLSTKWIHYDEILKIKLVEEMLEVYYNSVQYEITMKMMDVIFPNAFQFFLELGEFYREKGYLNLKHTRNRRCEILLEFLSENNCESMALIREALTFDIYYREYAKSRPTFAGKSVLTKAEYKKICSNGTQSHAEVFHYRFPPKEIKRIEQLPEYSDEPILIHFAYDQRDPLDHQACITEIRSYGGKI